MEAPPDVWAWAGLTNKVNDVLASHSRTHQRVLGTLLRSYLLITLTQYVSQSDLATKYLYVSVFRPLSRRHG
jgi:hypothetical protein